MEKEHRSLVWVFPGSLIRALDRATWVETAAELCRAGWQVTFVTADGIPDDLDPRIVSIQLPRPRLYLAGYFIFHALLLFRILSIRHKDIVLFDQTSALFLLPLARILRMLGRRSPRFVLDSRTIPMNTDSSRSRALGRLIELGNRLANRWADGQTAITQRLAEAVGIPATQLLGIWPSGVNTERFSSASILRRWPGHFDPLRLVYIGTLTEERNLLSVCRAVERARSCGLNITVSFIGAGPQKQVLEMFGRSSVNSGIEVQNAIPFREVPSLLANFDVGLLPFPDELKFRVSSPIKLFEYMASGMPVLATKIPCHTDVIGESDAAFWAEDASESALFKAMQECCERKADLPSLGKRALGLAQNWSWRQSAAKLSVALQKTLKSEYSHDHQHTAELEYDEIIDRNAGG